MFVKLLENLPEINGLCKKSGTGVGHKQKNLENLMESLTVCNYRKKKNSDLMPICFGNILHMDFQLSSRLATVIVAVQENQDHEE